MRATFLVFGVLGWMGCAAATRPELAAVPPRLPASLREAAAERALPEAAASESPAAKELPPSDSADSSPPVSDAPIELDPQQDPPRPICTIHGTGRPFGDECHDALLDVASDGERKTPIARIDLASVDIRFALVPGSAVAWTTVRGDNVEVNGYSSLEHQPFRLAFDAPSLGGHVVLKADDAVTISTVGTQGAFVTTSDDIVNIEDVVAEAPCGSLRFDPFEEPNESTDRGRMDAIPIGAAMHLTAAPGGPTIFTLRSNGDDALGLSLQIVDRVKDQRRVTFSTRRARFDAWVRAAEINENVTGGLGSGVGFGRCGGARDGIARTVYTALRDIDVLVAKAPTTHGPRGIKLTKGAVVAVSKVTDGWAEIDLLREPIFPPDGASFWVPRLALSRH